MRLAEAFEIVLGLADLYTKEHRDDELLEKQRNAIAEVKEFVRTYDFDDAPDTDETIYARVDVRGSIGPYQLWVALKNSDLKTDYDSDDAIRRRIELAGVSWNNIIGWSFYTKDENPEDSALANDYKYDR